MDLSVANVHSFSISTLSSHNMLQSNSPTVLHCANASIKLNFYSIATVSISGLMLVGCVNTQLFAIKHFALENSKLLGTHFMGTALIVNETSIQVLNTTFVSYFGIEWENIPYYHSTSTSEAHVGGAIVCSKSSMLISNSTFLKNKAGNAGGAIYGEKQCNITILKSTFAENVITCKRGFTCYGGVVTLVSASSVSVKSSTFNHNAVNGTGSGGVFGLDMSYLTINNSVIRENSAVDGGVISSVNSNVSIVHCNVINNYNHQNGENGGVISSSHSNITIFNCTIRNNTARLYGGVLYSVSSNIQLSESEFINNSAQYGGVAYLIYSTTESSKCQYIQNTALHAGGGVVYCKGIYDVTTAKAILEEGSSYYDRVLIAEIFKSAVFMDECTVFNNAATSGGVIFADKSYLSLNKSNYSMNMAAESGGVMTLSACIQISIDSDFHNNAAYTQAGVMYASGSYVIFNETNMVNNTAHSGGAINMHGGEIMLNHHIELINNKAHYGGAVKIDNSKVTSQDGNIVVDHNEANLGVFLMIHCDGQFYSLRMVHNIGSFFLLNSDIHIVRRSTYSFNKVPDFGKELYTEGGAITVLSSRITFAGLVLFTYNIAANGGAMFATSSRIDFSNDIPRKAAYNVASDSGGVFYLLRSQISVIGKFILSENKASNKGGAITAISSSIVLTFSRLQLTNNSAVKGGALSLEESSKITIASTMSMVRFEENKAFIGGALYVGDETNPSMCSSNENLTASASKCFYQQQSSLIEDSLNNNILNQMLFKKNLASFAGSILFGGLLDRCSVTIDDKKSIRETNSVRYFMEAGLLDSMDDITSYPVRICFCQDSLPDCNQGQQLVETQKGATFKVELVAVDQVNRPLNATIYSSLISEGNLLDNQLTQNIQDTCTHLLFNAFSPHETEELMMFAEGPCNNLGISRKTVNIKFTPCICAFGFEPSLVEIRDCKCVCDSRLASFITECNATTSSFTRKGNFWITKLDQINFFVHPHCPYDYCLAPTQPVNIRLDLQNGSDAQCAFDRSGLLCGTCGSSLSLSLGTSRCVRCPAHWPFLFVMITLAAIIAGILLVATILLLNLTVATGTLNGLIFYANVVAASITIFMPFKQPRFPTVFIAWLNLDVGFDVCYVKHMDTYAKTWLQLTFPTYVILLVIIVILICEYSTKFANFVGKKNPIATLATLILFSYAKLLHGIIAAMSFTILKYPNSSHEVVWRPDASVKFFRGKHIPLFLVAVVILIFGIVYTILLFSWQWLLRLSDKRIFKWIRNTKLNSFMDAYHAPYQPGNRYWTGLLLSARVILYLISASNKSGEPSVNLLAIIVIVTFLFLLKLRVYKVWVIDVLESGLYANLIILSGSKFFVLQTEGHHTSLAFISTSISFLIFVLIILYHISTETPVCKLRKYIKDRVLSPLHNDDITTHLLESDGNINSTDSSCQQVTYSVVEVVTSNTLKPKEVLEMRNREELF